MQGDSKEVKGTLIRVTYFGSLALRIPKFARKGDVLAAQGMLREWKKQGAEFPILQVIGTHDPVKVANRDATYYDDNKKETLTDENVGDWIEGNF